MRRQTAGRESSGHLSPGCRGPSSGEGVPAQPQGLRLSRSTNPVTKKTLPGLADGGKACSGQVIPGRL